MKKNSWQTFLLICVLGGVMAFGICRLFILRFQAGDVYPPYSSLRTDPLGTKVLHDALAQVRGFTVSRNFQPLDKIQDRENTTIFLANASPSYWQSDDVDSLEKLVKAGGARIVIALSPARGTSADAEPRPAKKSKKDKDESEAESHPIPIAELAKRWGFGIGRHSLPFGSAAPKARSATAETEPLLSWHTPIYFRNPEPVWRVLYKCNYNPVIIERRFGKGSIVMASDSYFLSNEAMQAERAPRLLALLAGTRTRLVFDETHLGVDENPGIATLIGKYHLEGLIAAIALLAGLFVWQTASPFLPAKVDADGPHTVAGRDSAAGFVSLLRREIAPSRLIEVCLDQWKKSFAHTPEKLSGTLERIDAAAAEGSRDPAGAYRTISQILAEKKYANQSR